MKHLLRQALCLAEERVAMYERVNSHRSAAMSRLTAPTAGYEEAPACAQGLRTLIGSACQHQSFILNPAAVPTGDEAPRPTAGQAAMCPP